MRALVEDHLDVKQRKPKKREPKDFDNYPRLSRIGRLLLHNQDFRFHCSKTVCDRRFGGEYDGQRPPASESPNKETFIPVQKHYLDNRGRINPVSGEWIRAEESIGGWHPG